MWPRRWVAGFLTTADALAVARKFHCLAAAWNIDITFLDEIDELLRLGSCPDDAALGRGFVDMRGYNGRRLDQFINCKGRFLSLHRKCSHVHDGQVDPVEVFDD